MKKNAKKFWPALLSFVFCITVFAGCGGGGNNNGPVNILLPYWEIDHTATETDFNSELFYRNELTASGADPSAIYVPKERDADYGGYFYMYVTSSSLGTSGFMGYKSKDLANWECFGVAFQPYRDGWAITAHWAPEVIYDEEDQTYYMYYSAYNTTNSGPMCTGLATSKSPEGPFVQYENANLGITREEPLFDYRKMPDDHELKEWKNNDKGTGKAVPMSVIDASPFIDPVTGDKYLYFTHVAGSADTSKWGHADCNAAGQSSLYAMRMNSWTDPDYNSVVKITHPNYRSISNPMSIAPQGTTDSNLSELGINEGSFTYYYEGKYYLTFSVETFENKGYQVRTAVGDTPLGPFRKLTMAEGGYLLFSESNWDHASGTGHHSFVEAEGELYIIYHAHVNASPGGARAIAADKIEFIKNNDGLFVPHANGPTVSPQPLPSAASGYKNIAPFAEITATKTSSDSSVTYLNDKIVKYHSIFSAIKEYEADAGSNVITIKFDDYRATRAILVANSYNDDLAIDSIRKIELDFKTTKDGKTVTGTAYTNRLYFNWELYRSYSGYMRPGGSFIVEYGELEVKEIRLYIDVDFDTQETYALSEITVLGK